MGREDGNGELKHWPGISAGGGAVVHVESNSKPLLIITIFAVCVALIATYFAHMAGLRAEAASARADQADRSAAISRLYAVQVYTELNRLGYPVKTPAEFDHELQPEDE